MDYRYLRQEYPAVIWMGQCYRICRISKRKARWLLGNGVIPCEDSGKQTRRFSIRLEGVIRFLEQQDAGLVEDAIPQGIFSSSSRPVRPVMRALDEVRLSAYLLAQWQGWPDMLTARQASELVQVQHEYPQPLVEPGAGGGGEIPGVSAVFKGVAGLLASVCEGAEHRGAFRAAPGMDEGISGRRAKQRHGAKLHVAVILKTLISFLSGDRIFSKIRRLAF